MADSAPSSVPRQGNFQGNLLEGKRGVIMGAATWFLVWSWYGNGFQVLRDLADARSFQGGLEGQLCHN